MSKYEVISGPYFPVFRLNTEIYRAFSPNTGKRGPETKTKTKIPNGIRGNNLVQSPIQ